MDQFRVGGRGRVWSGRWAGDLTSTSASGSRDNLIKGSAHVIPFVGYNFVDTAPFCRVFYLL